MFVKGHEVRVVNIEIALTEDEAQTLYRCLNIIYISGSAISDEDKVLIQELTRAISNKLHHNPMRK